MTDFERAHAFTALWEGGKVDHPADPGGRTAYGVTQGVYRAWRTEQRLPVRDVFQITPDEVQAIYQGKYWNAFPFPSRLPWPLSAAIYDMAVNHGGGRADSSNGAGGMLARAQAKWPKGTPLQVALAACDEREAFYRAIVAGRESQRVFLTGWLNRVNAQRTWLKENANMTTPAPLRSVFFQLDDNTVRGMDEKASVYNGEHVVRLADGRVQIGGVIITVFEDGALKLERSEPKATPL